MNESNNKLLMNASVRSFYFNSRRIRLSHIVQNSPCGMAYSDRVNPLSLAEKL